MTSRTAVATRAAVALLPLIALVALGSLVATLTLSWGKAFIIWQFVWWLLVSAVVGFTSWGTAKALSNAIPRHLDENDIQRLARIVYLTGAIAAIACLAGFATSIWIMVIGRVASVPIEVYWPLPTGIFLFVTTSRVDEKRQTISSEGLRMRKAAEAETKAAGMEAKRKLRCALLTSAERSAYESEFLMTLYSLQGEDSLKEASDTGWIPLSTLVSRLNNECTPELLPAALQRWKGQQFILHDRSRRDNKEYVALLDAGRYVCGLAASAGMEAAVREHNRCAELGEAEVAEYQGELLMQIDILSRKLHSSSISREQLLSAQKHPCWRELINSSLQVLADLGLVEFPEDSYTRYRHPQKPLRGYMGYRQVELTGAGKRVTLQLGRLGSGEVAFRGFRQEAQREAEREKRCLAMTDVQRVEFENQFLQALYITTAGDTREATLREVWSQLDHECAPELTEHALRVWYERKDILVDTTERRSGRIDFYIYERERLSLTVAGRDLCRRAIELRSMQAALDERREGAKVSQNEYNQYNIQNANVVGTHAHVHDNDFAQFINSIDSTKLNQLAQELALLRKKLAEKAPTATPEELVEIGEVAAAEVAAKEHDARGVWDHLTKVKKWVLDVADQISVSLVVETIRTIFNYYKIPM
jgi:hypothetical protein